MRRFRTAILTIFAACSADQVPPAADLDLVDEPPTEEPLPRASAPGFGGRTGSLIEEIRIDGLAQDLVPISALTVRQDGVIAITQSQDRVIRFFTAAGQPLGRFGGQGSGPGEFTGLSAVGWLADTLWVLDGTQLRVTLIAPSLRLGRMITNLPRATRPDSTATGQLPVFQIPRMLGLRRDGMIYGVLDFLSIGTVPPEEYRDRAMVGLLEPNGNLQRILLISPPGDGIYARASTGFMALPLPNVATAVAAPDASRLAVVVATLEGEEAGTLHVTTVDPNGDTLYSRRYAFEPERMPPAVGDSIIRAAIGRMPAMTSPELAAEFRRLARPRSIYPPLYNVVLGRDGTLWLGQRARDGDRTYYVVAADGEPIGSVLLPENSRVAAAFRDRIWTIERDALGVESIVRFAVSW